MERRHGWRTALLFLAVASVTLRTSADDNNVSGLRGQQLRELRDASGIIGALTGGGAKISRVEVVRDALQLVELDVAYANVTGQKMLRVEVQARNKRRVPISAAPVEIRNASGNARIVLQLDAGQAEGTSIESSRVVLRMDSGTGALTAGGSPPDAGATTDTGGVVGAIAGILGGLDGGGAAGLVPGFTFELVKQWTVPVRPENVVVNVTPVAVGTIPTAAPASGGGTAPPKIFKLDVMPMAVRDLQVAPRAAVVRHEAMVVSQEAMILATQPPPRVTVAAATTTVSAAPHAMVISEISPAFRKLKTIDQVKGLPPDRPDAEGPSNRSIPLFSRIVASAGSGITTDKLTSIDPNLYQDKNAQSGIYYYLPSRYTLYWDSDNGYALRMCYGAAAADAQGSVTMSARLTSGIDLSELELLRTLLRSAILPPAKFTQLRPFPIAAAPAFSLRNDLRQFNIPPEKVVVPEISDIAGQVDLLITTDTVTKETIEALLTQGRGLSGSATFSSAGADGFSRSIPVEIRLADPHSFGTRYWQRAQELRNTTPFPIRLKYLHFLTMAPDGSPTVYSYSLGDSEVPAGAKAQIAPAAVQAWLDGKAVKAWIDYSVAERDESGIAAARQQFACGATQLTSSTLAISSLTPFAEPGGIARIVVEIRSRYFDAQAQDEQVQSVTLGADNETKSLRLFLVNRSADTFDAAGNPLFTYRVSVVRPDGTRAGPGEWRSGQELELFIGSSQVAPLLGSS